LTWKHKIQFTPLDKTLPGLFFKTLVYNTTCGTSLPAGDIGSNGYYFSGVWDACLNTWFSSQAWLNNLPLVLK
ncbi:hypothetical protein, partial [Vibrio sp.]|uniref:hypothetical protein n=1 Tax=Vibrio sp. TaxID=678 RepID=UPI003D115C54